MALGNLICRPPRSFGKVKRAVDVFGDICQASLLHLTKAAVSFLNSFSGQIITGPEKAEGGLGYNRSVEGHSRWRGPCSYAKNKPSLQFRPLHIFFEQRYLATCCSECPEVEWVFFHGSPSALLRCTLCQRVSTRACTQGRVG